MNIEQIKALLTTEARLAGKAIETLEEALKGDVTPEGRKDAENCIEFNKGANWVLEEMFLKIEEEK